jgi:hypothetical protein
MAIPASFDSATGALAATGDDLDNTIATGHDATRPTPSLRGDPDAGGQIQSAVHGATPSLRSDPDSGGQLQSAVTPSLRDDPDAGGQIQSALQQPMPSLWDDPDAGGQIQSVVQQFAGGQHTFTASDVAGASDQLMLGATSRLVQATASFSAAGAADTSTALPLGAETSQPAFLTTPQHP